MARLPGATRTVATQTCKTVATQTCETLTVATQTDVQLPHSPSPSSATVPAAPAAPAAPPTPEQPVVQPAAAPVVSPAPPPAAPVPVAQAPVPPPQDADDTLRKEIGNKRADFILNFANGTDGPSLKVRGLWMFIGVAGAASMGQAVESGVFAGAVFFAGGFEAWEISLAGVIAAARQGGLAGALELLAENQPVVGHAYETLHMLGAAAKIAGGSGAAQSSLNSIRIVQVDWGSVRSGHSGIFKGYNLIIGEGANVYTIESTFGEILNWKPDWLITRDLLFAAGVERLDQLKFQKYTGKEGKVVPTGMIHGGARYVPAAVLERKETTAAALLDYKCMREGCGNVFKATGTTTTDMRCVNGTKVGCQSTKVVRVKLAYKAVGEGGAMKIKLSREAEPL